MSQTEKKLLDVSLTAIQERSFTFNYDYNPEGFDIENMQIQFGLNAIPKIDKDLLGIELTIVLNDNKSVTELSRLQILLWFYVEDMRSVVSEKEGKIDIKSKDLITMGLNTSIGTARGILYTRLKGTFLEKFPLPLLNTSEILTNIANKRNG